MALALVEGRGTCSVTCAEKGVASLIPRLFSRLLIIAWAKKRAWYPLLAHASIIKVGRANEHDVISAVYLR